MAGETNDDYDGWHLVHNGSRVRKSLGVTGNYFNKYASAPWVDGSMNKAVYETALLNGQDVSGYDGFWEYDVLKSKTIVDMLYGKNGEAQGTSPIDTASFRAYPTGTFSLTSNKEVVSGDKWGYDGSLIQGSEGSRYANTSATVNLDMVLPYDVIFRIRVKYDGTPTERGDVYVKIVAGDSAISKYSEDNVSFSSLPDGKVYFWEEVTGQTGDKIIATDIFETSLDDNYPYYANATNPIDAVSSVTIEEADVTPPPTWERIGDTDNYLAVISTNKQVFMCYNATYPNEIYIDPIHYGTNKTAVYRDTANGNPTWTVGDQLASGTGGAGLDTAFRTLTETFYIDESDTFNGKVRVLLLVPVDSSSVLDSTVSDATAGSSCQ